MENLNEQNDVSSAGNKANNDKIVGILSYLWILWIVAYILYGKEKSDFKLFHIRQGLGLFIIWLIVVILSNFLPSIINLFLYVAITVFEIIGIISVLNGEQKELPFIGEFINENLKNFN